METLVNTQVEVGEGERRRISADSVSHFLFAGHATITLRHAPSGERFTFKVSVPKNPRPGSPVHFVALLRGPSNTDDYTYMGLILDQKEYRASERHISKDARSQKWFSRFFTLLTTGAIPDTLEVWHEGRCGRCGRKLTVPESIEMGIGPECASRMGF